MTSVGFCLKLCAVLLKCNNEIIKIVDRQFMAISYSGLILLQQRL